MCQNAVGQKKLSDSGFESNEYTIYMIKWEKHWSKRAQRVEQSRVSVCVCVGGGGGGGRQVADGGVIIHILPGGAAQAFKSSDTNK